MRQLVYLHGFASSPRSGKAVYFAGRAAETGCRLHCPDLNEPDFSTLTITRMVEQVEATIARLPPAPVAVIGSSLGAFVALHVAGRQREAAREADSRQHPIGRLVLLAPAVRFDLTDERHPGRGRVAEWRATDRLDVYHYGYHATRPLGFAIYRDAEQWNGVPLHVDVPTLVFHGRRDEVVSPALVEAFATAHPSVTLRMLDDDHQLHAHLDQIWTEMAAFLGLTRQPEN